MAINISKLYNDIKGSIKNLTGLSPNMGDMYPKDSSLKDIQSSIIPENWKKLPFPYTFSVQNVKMQGNSPFVDFELPLAPSKISQTEDFAISIKSTQGGTVVSHSGNKYKSLQISGTTGIAPFRGTGGVDNSTGQAILQPNDLKHKSGYEVFLELRNWFKTYYEWKKLNKDANVKDSRLIFKNYKDGEWLIVELLSFTMDRQAGRPYLYDYNMQFKVLKHFEFSTPSATIDSFSKTINGALDKLNNARGTFLRSQEIVKQIESTFDGVLLEPIRKIGLVLRSAIGLSYSLADLPKNIAQSTLSIPHTISIMNGLKQEQTTTRNKVDNSPRATLIRETTFPADIEESVNRDGIAVLYNLGETITLVSSSTLPETSRVGLLADIESSSALPRSYYLDTLDNLIRMRQNAEDMFNLGDTDYDTLFDRTSTITADPSKIITENEIDVLSGFNDAIDAIIDLLSTQDLFKNTYDKQIKDIMDSFDKGELKLQSTKSVKEITLSAGTDLERLALNYLGDSARWPEIAELNNLESPFVTQDVNTTYEHVAVPGDKLLIPVSSSFGDNTTPDVIDIPSTIDLSYLEKKLGTDLRLSPDFDLCLGNSGDLEVISGAENMGQQIVLKISYEKGDLLNYPMVGSNLVVGSKVKPLSIMKDDLIRTLRQDPRISKVTNVAIVQDNSAFYITFNVYVKNIDMPIPMTLGL